MIILKSSPFDKKDGLQSEKKKKIRFEKSMYNQKFSNTKLFVFFFFFLPRFIFFFFFRFGEEIVGASAKKKKNTLLYIYIDR